MRYRARSADLDDDGRDGGWHDVMPADGALRINLGDLMARWTNERWMSAPHRVKPPVVDGSIRRRRSAAFFHDGNIDAVIETLPTCVGAGSRAGVANTDVEREVARVLAAQTSA